jgi:tryptophanyl-tRNA synthetase
MGEMGRMTQFKDKSAKLSEDRISVGLFNYPVLMAADILLYNASYVPVGDDQSQHLEITRDIGTRMNQRFGELFTLPEAVKDQHAFFGKDQGLRIKDLQDPTKKMSKSDEFGKGVIFLSDSPEEAAKKIMSATTDDLASIHYDEQNQPGITNLIDLLALFRGTSPAEVTAEFEGQDRYGDFKKVVADEVSAFLTDFQERLAAVDMKSVEQKLQASETAMTTIANQTLNRVQVAVGLRRS